MKRLSDLISECREKGISIPEGTRVSKEDLITRLANHHHDGDQGISPLEQILPQLAKDIEDLSEQEKDAVLRSDQYAAGEKKNGIRGILHVRPEGNRFTSRNRCVNTYLLNELTENVPHLKGLDLREFEDSIFDGELYLPGDFVELDDSTNTLEATAALLHCSPDKARAFQEKDGQKIHYHIFDVLRANGQDAVSLPLRERLKYLNEFKVFIELSGQGQHIQFENLILHDKDQYFKTIIKAGGEGIVFKDLNAPYRPGARSRSWLKLKKHTPVDAIIIGFERGKEWDKKGLIGSVKLGIFDECGALRSIGSVSSFPLQRRISMTELIDSIPTLRQKYLGTVVECRFHDLNKNLKGRHLQILNFREGSNSKSISDCHLDLSRWKEKLNRAGILIPASLDQGLLQIQDLNIQT